MKKTTCLFLVCASLVTASAQVKIQQFYQEKSHFYIDSQIPLITDIAVTADGSVFVGTNEGLFKIENNKYKHIKNMSTTNIISMAVQDSRLYILAERNNNFELILYQEDQIKNIIRLKKTDLFEKSKVKININTGYIFSGNKLYIFSLIKRYKPKIWECPEGEINAIAVESREKIWVAVDQGLLTLDISQKKWSFVYPRDANKRWAPTEVYGLIFDSQKNLWFASSQGIGRLDSTDWSLFTGVDGLPYNKFTCAAADSNGAVWFGTTKGAIRFDGEIWEYRQGLQWLPDDSIKNAVADKKGNVWFITSKGIGMIERYPMTLAQKAHEFEKAIDCYHRRTPYEFVLHVGLENPGDTSSWTQYDSDNDGLWTSMYGAGECFAYAATGDTLAKIRAKKVFDALQFLGEVTQGGDFPAPPGFVARTVLSTDGPDPNEGRVERDKKLKETRDKLWKIIDPRWPVSADGKWYWKCDTSSDELDGHYFFYGLYYDLVADTKEEKTRVRQQVAAITDHLIEHNFQLVDHDGLPTRWARFNPYELNFDVNWVFDRGLNSLSILSYLITAAHITENVKYEKYAQYLVDNFGYLQNAMNPKTQRGLGTGNQSDDEMAFMCLYNFLKYCKIPEWNERMFLVLWSYWRLEQAERNPFFNFVCAACCSETTFSDAWGNYSLDPTGLWLEESLFTLKKFPLDRINWAHENSSRLDIVFFADWMRAFDEGSYENRGNLANGYALPVDERHFNHWNHDPWQLDTGGDGKTLADGAVYLLPYYMGLYHGFFQE